MISSVQWEELINTGIELSSYKNVDKLLDRIAEDSIEILQCHGASIYIRKGDHLDFMITRNIMLEQKLGTIQSIFQKYSIPISNESISGYVALTHAPLNISDAYHIAEKEPYKFSNSFDSMNDYRTQSLLTLPMLDNSNDLIGVIQLINKYDDSGIKEFSQEDIFIAKYLCSLAAMAIKNASFNEILKHSHYDTVYRLAVASEFRDLETSFHIKRMSEITALLWKKLGHTDEEVEEVKYAAQMHDIGKLGIPDHILQKPGLLTPEERKIMETHTTMGAKILEGSYSPLLQISKTIALSHHEKWDGSGYPAALKEKKIPLIGRVTAIADVFDALTSKRVYKPAYHVDKVLQMIRQESGKHFDPEIVEVFFHSIHHVLAIFERYKE